MYEILCFVYLASVNSSSLPTASFFFLILLKSVIMNFLQEKSDFFSNFGVLYIEGVILRNYEKEDSMKATSISLSLDAAGIEAKHDASAKRILSYKAVLAWILKLNTAEFRD